MGMELVNVTEEKEEKRLLDIGTVEQLLASKKIQKFEIDSSGQCATITFKEGDFINFYPNTLDDDCMGPLDENHDPITLIAIEYVKPKTDQGAEYRYNVF